MRGEGRVEEEDYFIVDLSLEMVKGMKGSPTIVERKKKKRY